MTFEIPGDVRSYETTGDMSASFLKFVKQSGALVVAVTAATDDAIGVLQNEPGKPGVGVFQGGENNTAAVMINGVTRVKAGAAIAAGVAATIDAQGRVVGAAAGNPIAGVTQSAAGAADEIVALEIKPLGLVVV